MQIQNFYRIRAYLNQWSDILFKKIYLIKWTTENLYAQNAKEIFQAK